jgi:hypothetical protein
MTTKEEESDQLNTFVEVEELMIHILREVTPREYYPEQNVCCSAYERNFLFNTAKKLKQLFPSISFKDICIAVIYTYYGLHLSEQIIDFLNIDEIDEYTDNTKDVTYLYLRLGAPSSTQEEYGEIIFNDENLSQEFRKFIMNSPPPSQVSLLSPPSESTSSASSSAASVSSSESESPVAKKIRRIGGRKKSKKSKKSKKNKKKSKRKY